ncbi:MAG: hypothetical protein ACYC55_08465, partial [Candidatus Geothermincolia bacterium]
TAAPSIAGGCQAQIVPARDGDQQLASDIFTLHPDDRVGLESRNERRRFKSWGHLLHHLRGTARSAPRLASIYLGRIIAPKFRERIMLVVTSANQCPL